MNIAEILVVGAGLEPSLQYAINLVTTVVKLHPGRVPEAARKAICADTQSIHLPNIIPVKGPLDLVQEGTICMPSSIINAARLRTTGSLTGALKIQFIQLRHEENTYVICWIMN